jgi:hypothetical protein
MKKLLLLSLLFVGAPAVAQDTQIIGRETKRTVGTVVRMDYGDAACYITFKDDKGEEFDESADFAVCDQKPDIQGKRVRMSYTQSKVMSPDCQGDMKCKKTQTVALITAAKIEPRGNSASSNPLSNAASSKVAAKAAGQSSFCTPLEVNVFTCKSGVKMASVCASKTHSKNKGYLQYRFGKFDSNEPLEMMWPEGEVAPSKAAKGEYTPYAGGGGIHLRFTKGNTSYIVYSGTGRWGPKGETMDKQGIAVERDGKLIANLKCAVMGESELGPDWFEKSGIQPSDKEFVFP